VTDQPEEVLRFVDAIKALEEIDDDAACAKAITDVLQNWPESHARLREIRQQRVLRMRNQGKTWQEIGDALGIHFTRAQQISKGLRGSKRPKKGEGQTGETAGHAGPNDQSDEPG
jgi:DNA-directed RNA polymerase sigma subunit (sigma70/sigma32)